MGSRPLIDAADRFAVPEPLDLVWTAQNYHDPHDAFMKPIDIAAMNAAIYRALKPGGVYLIIDHAAEAGSGLRDTETLHRIDPQSVRTEVTAAGFVFEGESGVLRNPDDSHLLRVFDPAIRHRTLEDPKFDDHRLVREGTPPVCPDLRQSALPLNVPRAPAGSTRAQSGP